MSGEPQNIFDGIQVLAEQVHALRVEVQALRSTSAAPEQLWLQLEDLKQTVLKSLDRAAKKGSARLLSKSAAARRLNISRNDTLEYLIRSKQLTTVRVGKRLRIPATEVERLAQSGFVTSASGA